jgi:hypothetical protein
MARSYRRSMGGRRRTRRTGGTYRHEKKEKKRKGGNPAFQNLALPLSLYAASTMVDRRSLRDYTRKHKRHHKKHGKSKRR